MVFDDLYVRSEKKELIDRVVDELFSSAVEFFESSIDLFIPNPKFSIIHFAIALELMLKTKLAHQDLSLLLAEPDTFDTEKFKSGDFVSVNAANIVREINNISPKEITKREKRVYNEVFFHRNKIIHYFHGGLDSSESRNEILQKILQAWYFLNLKITDWKDRGFLSRHYSSIYRLQRKMGVLSEYSSSIYEFVKDDLKQKEMNGVDIQKCDVCSQLSSFEEKVYFPGTIFREVIYLCAVCSTPKHKIFVVCPECAHFDEFFGMNEKTLNCAECGHSIDDDLESASGIDWDIKTSRTVYCPSCGLDTVIVDGDNFYVCLHCGNYGANTDCCEWCNSEFFSFDSEGSYVDGCSLCEGIVGHRKDD
jgi:hypothetical protein